MCNERKLIVRNINSDERENGDAREEPLQFLQIYKYVYNIQFEFESKVM